MITVFYKFVPDLHLILDLYYYFFECFVEILSESSWILLKLEPIYFEHDPDVIYMLCEIPFD